MKNKFRIIFLTAVVVLPISAESANYYQRQEITATQPGSAAQFGYAVATDRDYMIVGAPYDSAVANEAGAAYIFTHQASGQWRLLAVLRANDGQAGDHFGSSVAIAGAIWIIGADHADAPLSNSGAAYVFTRCGSSCWIQGGKLTANDAAAGDQFGTSVAINFTVSGVNHIVVGASNANSGAGAAYRFEGNGIGAMPSQRLSAFPVVPGDHFGASMAISGNKLVVGAPGDDTEETDAGAVYRFTDNGSSYGPRDKLTLPTENGADQLGSSVAIDGDRIVGGAIEDSNVAGQSGVGAAFLFSFHPFFLQIQKLTASDGQALDHFGYSVAIKGDTIAVGARDDDTTAGMDTGSAYIYNYDSSVPSLTESQKFVRADPSNGDRFGASMFFNTYGGLLIGAPEKTLTSNGQGALYLFAPGVSVPFDYDNDHRTDISVFRPSTSAWYLQGYSVYRYGQEFGLSTDKITPADYDGDGRTDIAVYRPSTSTWYVWNSANYVLSYYVFGLAEDLPTPADYDGDGRADISVFRPSTGTWYRQNSSNGSFFGVQFGASEDKPTVGDFDGDEKADIAVFRPSTGAWYRINSSDGSNYGDLFGLGSDVLVPADYDGDHKTDLAVYRPSTGIWYVKNSSNSNITYTYFGLSTDIPSPGDFDGDGKADLCVFRPSDGNWYRQNSSGGAFVASHFGTNGDKPTMTAFRY